MTQTKEQTPNDDVTYSEFLHDRIRAARDAFVADRSRRSQPFTDAAQLDFLSLLSVGMPITEITAILGVASSTIYYRRHTDQEFARQWALAVEMRYTHLEDRLDHVAMNCPIDSTAGVRAAEILLKASNPRYRPDPHGERPAPQPQRFPHGLGLAPTADYPDRGLPPGWEPPRDEPLRFPAAREDRMRAANDAKQSESGNVASHESPRQLQTSPARSTQHAALSPGAAAPPTSVRSTQHAVLGGLSRQSLRRRLATA